MKATKAATATNAELAMRAVLRGEPLDTWTRAALENGAVLLRDLSNQWVRETEWQRRVEAEGPFVRVSPAGEPDTKEGEGDE